MNTRVVLIALCLCFLLAACAEAGQAPSWGSYDPGATRAAAMRSWTRFNEQHQRKWQVEWNPVTGTPRRVSGGQLPVTEQLTKETAERVTRRLLEAHRELLQIDPAALVLSKADFDPPRSPEAGAGTWYVYYRQVYRGRLVYGGSVRLVIRNQQLTTLGADYYRGIGLAPDPKISERQAAGIAIRQSGAKARSFKPVSSELLVYPESIAGLLRYHLAWQVILPVLHVPRGLVDRAAHGAPDGKTETEKIPVQWSYFIDATTGDVIARVNLMVEEDLTGAVTGLIHPSVAAGAPLDPPQQPASIARMTVTVDQGGVPHTAETDASGQYTVSGLAAGPATLTAHLTGPHVVVHNNETADPDATHTAAVMVPGVHDWDWTADDPSPQDVEVNAFYHVNLMRDWFLRGDPFDISPLPHPMPVYVRDGAYCNAGAGASGLSFGSGTPGGCSDYSLCSDIVYHEYTHRIVARVYGDAGVSLPYSGQTGAMNEGWSDYFAATVVNNPNHGAPCSGGRNIDTPDKRFPDNWGGEVHYDSPIFSGAIWDTRTTLSANYVDGLAFRAEKQVATSFSEYLGAFLEEDDDPAYSPSPLANSNPADGTPNIGAICHSFYDVHGVYHNYCQGNTENPVAVITSPPPTQFNLYNSAALSIDIIGTAARSSGNPLDHFVIEYANVDAPAVWLTAGVAPTGGGTAEVLGATLATWNIAGVPDGMYNVRLTVTDTGAHTSSCQTQVVIDKLLRNGWPQNTNTWFDYPPAAGNIDPSTPQLEVAIASGANVYVYHHDGTLYAPWPLPAGSWVRGAPAVADLDNDGDMEIVAVSLTGIRAWHHTGAVIFTAPFGAGGTDHYIYASPTVWDLDKDGDLEIIAGGPDGNVYIVHHDGSAFTSGGFTWPKAAGGAVRATAAVADLDGDGEVEIVVGTQSGNVYAWNLDGSNVAGWPIAIGQPVISSPAIGDIDGDASHDLEVVVGADNGQVYAWHHNGGAVAGWPVATPAVGNQVWASPALADVDADGGLEICVYGRSTGVKVFEPNGIPYAPWVPATSAAFGCNSPAIGDLDGDDTPEIVAGSYNGKLYAFHPNGTLATGFPRITAGGLGSMFYGGPLITDLDKDGHPEVITGSKGLYVWSLPSSYTPAAQDWPAFHHDNWHTGYRGPRSGVALLFDTSGSMSWHWDGTMGVPVDQQRLTLAKQAAYPFMDMFNDFNSGRANFGIATFPSHPAGLPFSCAGQTVTPMTLLTDATNTTANTVTIPGLITEDNTPLLAGLETAAGLFGVEANKAIVLLSDGYHNCPHLVGVGDPEVTGLIDHLRADGIRVFTIGFAQPTDVDHPLLAALASQTTPPGFVGSQFHDVTTPAFTLPWDPGLALQETYKAILVDALDLEAAVDPRGTIAGGTSKSVDIGINEHDRAASFFLSWVTPKQDRLELMVTSADGQAVPLVAPGVRVHRGETYTIISVDKSFLQQPGKVGPVPWKLTISAPELGAGISEKYQYSVILDSALKLRASAGRPSYGTGDAITLTARLTEAGQPVPNLADVTVSVARPGGGLGNWLVTNRTSAAELKRTPERRGGELLSPVQRKAGLLVEKRHVKFPTQAPPTTVRLYDDGTHGDAKAGDGVYTNRYSDTVQEGSYSFHFQAAGPTRGGNQFNRDEVIQKYVAVKVRPQYVLVTAVRLALAPRNVRRYQITITPKDARGNYLGPGHPEMVKLTATRAEFVGDLHDNLDGTYSRVLQAPAARSVKEVKLTISVKEGARSLSLEEAARRRR